MSRISVTTRPMLSALSASCCIVWLVASASRAALPAISFDCVTWRLISAIELDSCSAALETVWTLLDACSLAPATVPACRLVSSAVWVMVSAIVPSLRPASSVSCTISPTVPSKPAISWSTVCWRWARSCSTASL